MLLSSKPQRPAKAFAYKSADSYKLRSCPEDAGPLAEAFRRANLVDVSLGAVRFGLPRAFVTEVRAALPNAGFHRCLAWVFTDWVTRHPTRPLPMMRW